MAGALAFDLLSFCSRRHALISVSEQFLFLKTLLEALPMEAHTNLRCWLIELAGFSGEGISFSRSVIHSLVLLTPIMPLVAFQLIQPDSSLSMQGRSSYHVVSYCWRPKFARFEAEPRVQSSAETTWLHCYSPELETAAATVIYHETLSPIKEAMLSSDTTSLRSSMGCVGDGRTAGLGQGLV